MGAELSVIQRGFSRLVVRLKDGPRKRRKAVAQCMDRDIGPLVADLAKEYAPKKDGALESSIEHQARGMQVLIAVPINSPAGQYAEPMHENEYIAGPGTVAKGDQAGRLYITRAIDDSLPRMSLILGKCIISVS